jgi:hypothetical protein
MGDETEAVATYLTFHSSPVEPSRVQSILAGPLQAGGIAGGGRGGFRIEIEGGS